MKNKFCREILSLIFMTLLFLQMPAQQKALKIGDKIPLQVWKTPLQVVNSPQKTIDLSVNKDKLILLDFWATWCSGCLLSMPKMEELQKQFGDQINIQAVTYQDRPTLEKFFLSKNGQRYNSIISVAGDKMLHDLFPHKGVPYIVWIKDGKLLNMTDAEQVTEKSINEVLKNQESLQTVVQLQRNRPLMLSEAFDLERGLELQNYSFFAKGRIRSANFGSWFHTSNNKVYGRRFTNLSLLDILRAITAEIFKQQENTFNDKKIIVEVKKPQLLNYIENKEGKREDFNRYNYEYIVPIAKADSLYQMMLRNLNQFIDYTAIIEKRPAKCLVLKRISGKDQLMTKGGELKYLLTEKQTSLQNAPFSTFVSGLEGLPFVTVPIVNETVFKGNIDLKMGGTPNISALRKELALYDLELMDAERNIDMLIIRDKINSN
ncbi:MAG: TlpA family protein disulfide reductase [Flavobacteriales bacterium]|nr:TlpA family protein disulfide reductase [Flavobacteriales bacterium]